MLQTDSLTKRIERVEGLLSKLEPIPKDWIKPRESKRIADRLECIHCERWTRVVLAWRKALRWTDGLDCALSVMLASITSTKTIGDQLWIKIIGPAACGKSTLCEALSVNSKYVLAKSTIRGFHSGFKTDRDGEEDNSLVALVKDKTLVTKDGDTLLQSPNLGQILSEARDLYDCTSRTHYRNKTSRDYSGVRMTWLLCGTSSLRSIDSSELGERFLDCVIMEGIDDDLEDEILWRVANRADRNVMIESDGAAVTQHEPELVTAMQLTGGYVDYLRKNATELLSAVDNPEWARRRCTRLGKFVAYMRARPSIRQDENSEREFAARLVSQHIRLAKCLAVVLNKDQVDTEVMRRVRKVALDTSRGVILEICKRLYHAGSKGLQLGTVSLYINRGDDKTRTLLRFMNQIGVALPYQEKVKGVKKHPRWRLTERFIPLWEDVIGTE